MTAGRWPFWICFPGSNQRKAAFLISVCFATSIFLVRWGWSFISCSCSKVHLSWSRGENCTGFDRSFDRQSRLLRTGVSPRRCSEGQSGGVQICMPDSRFSENRFPFFFDENQHQTGKMRGVLCLRTGVSDGHQAVGLHV